MSGIDIKPLIGVTTPDLQGFFSVDSKIDQLLGQFEYIEPVDGEEPYWIGGIAFHDVVICGCCGGTVEISELYKIAEKNDKTLNYTPKYPTDEFQQLQIVIS